MAKGDYLGEFEHLVLLALLRLKDEAYGARIRREIQQRTERKVAIGAVYATLERLERKGWVMSDVSDPEPVPGGRARRYFRLTPEGARAMQRSRDLVQKMTQGMTVENELRSI